MNIGTTKLMEFMRESPLRIKPLHPQLRQSMQETVRDNLERIPTQLLSSALSEILERNSKSGDIPTEKSQIIDAIIQNMDDDTLCSLIIG